MAFKYYVPNIKEVNWEEYWDKTNIQKNLVDCDSDGLLPILEKYLPKPGKILEAGCGLGKWVIYLSERGYDVWGIDSFPGAISALKKFNKSLVVNVDSVEKLKIKSDIISSYLSFGVVEHFEEGPQKPLSEAWRVLKKGGIAVVETPCDTLFRKLGRLVDSLKIWVKTPARIFVEGLKLRPQKVRLEKKFYEYHYTPGELKNFVEQAGFRILEVLPKDDRSADRSIGLWLDYPMLRQKDGSTFQLNSVGRVIKMLLSPFPSLWSACVVVIAQKD